MHLTRSRGGGECRDGLNECMGGEEERREEWEGWILDYSGMTEGVGENGRRWCKRLFTGFLDQVQESPCSAGQ